MSPPLPPLATIGYEGATVRDFLQAVQAEGTELLVDVRALASSRRPGFAKTALAANLQSVGIEYLHLRRLGTPAEGRAAARAGQYDRLRTIFMEHLASDEAQEELHRLAGIVRSGRRVCLLCFEADPAHCHRRFVADALTALVPLEVHDIHPEVDE